MSNQNTTYKHTLGPWASGQSQEEVEASVTGATAHVLGPWARGEVDINGQPVVAVAEKPKSEKRGRKGKPDTSEPSTPPAGEPDADADDEKALNGETPAPPLVS